MWSTALDAIWTTLRYLAPATLLTLLWGQQGFIFKLLKYIDSAFRALLFSSENQKQAVLQWLTECGPVRVEELDTVWRHGWILCGVLDAALPGSCAGHPPTNLSIKHAQAIAEHYLGVEPVFSRQELEENLSKHQQWRLVRYIDSVRQALTRVSPLVTKPSNQKTSPDTGQFIFDYVARGSGLSVAQINSTMHFKIYPTSQQSLDPGDIKIIIKGPNKSYGMRILPPVLGKAQMIRQELLGNRSQTNYTENTLPLAHGTTYLRNYGKNDMAKTYHIPKTKYDIEIDVESMQDHLKVGYVVSLEGKYEIAITSKEQNIVGSPYVVTASKNVIGLLEKENFCLEDGEEIDIVDVKNDRKVVLRIVDFVTEKMLLKENGALEKITEDEAKYLMESDVHKSLDLKTEELNINSANDNKRESKNFNEVANKILKLNYVCKLFNTVKGENENALKKSEINTYQRKKQDIPDIVNSTFNRETDESFALSDKRDKFIVPENISVSILTEKMERSESCVSDDSNDDKINLDEIKLLRNVSFVDQDHSNASPLSANNPFLSETGIAIEKILNTFVTSEYETNKPHNEETDDNTNIQITIENCKETLSMTKSNPFIDFDILNIDRPKSPVFKIISSDSNFTRESSCIVSDMNETINPSINPFSSPPEIIEPSMYKPDLPIADFIIGAPVSLPPEMRSLSQETVLKSLNTINEQKIKIETNQQNKNNANIQSSSHAIIDKTKNNNSLESFCLSAGSNLTDNTDGGGDSAKKDMWDSAYVSIDENNTLPDSNNNEHNLTREVQHKQKNLSNFNLLNMGPAERELWENCAELQELGSNKVHNEVPKINKLDLTKTRFTPIIEESVSTGMKGTNYETAKFTETDPITLAFAEINDLYNDYFQSSEESSITSDDKNSNLNVEHNVEYENEYIKSASVKVSDVMRCTIPTEGEISEIQTNVTESVSVSQTLHGNEDDASHTYNKDQIKFGDSEYTNIVLEKKKYWDDKIKQIEAEESKIQQRKRRLSAKQLRHNDSLSKRRGKQIVKKYLTTSETIQKQNRITDSIEDSNKNNEVNIRENVDIKRVKIWKTFWDSKLESENNELPTTNASSLKVQNSLSINEQTANILEAGINQTGHSLPVKQEIPEEVFKAFETSPKRFFGTSRKQILNKLDTFSSKPHSVEEQFIDNDINTYESGLVSSRISLFHNISQTEDVPQEKLKIKTMQNIFQQQCNETLSDTICSKSTSVLRADINSEKKSIENQQNNKEQQKSTTEKHITLKEKRARVSDKFYTKSVDETSFYRTIEDYFPHGSYVKKTIQLMNKHQSHSPNELHNVRKLSSSKSEMDIFNKCNTKSIDEDFDKYKSCEELPKVSVKNFISLYEDVTKSSMTKPNKVCSKESSDGIEKRLNFASSTSGTANITAVEGYHNIVENEKTLDNNKNTSINTERDTSPEYKEKALTSQETVQRNITDSSDECRVIVRDFDEESTYISLSDIDIEIVENRSEKSIEMSPDRDVEVDRTDYKSRFKIAKQYFQSLEELREVKKQNKLNECELLLYNKSTESLADNNQGKRNKKNIKSHTMPSSQISEYLSQLHEQQKDTNENRPVKISEKFQVEDLFSDVMDGRLSRQGSLRGIPHKKAVLEAFRSMENIADNNLSPYELAVSQFSDFTNENKSKNAQTYLSEYPYLPTTDPSKFHSRLDVNASGLISFKELLSKKDRRNSVPDLRLNPSFTVDL